MQLSLPQRLRQIGQSLLGLLLFGMMTSPFQKGYPGSFLIYYITSAVSLLLSTLLFYLIWRSQRWERWNGYRVVLLFIGSCLAVSYPGWVYAPTWGLSPLLGHVLGLLVGGVLGVGIRVWENRAINARKGALVAR